MDKQTRAIGSIGFHSLLKLLFLCTVLMMLMLITSESGLADGSTEYSPVSDFTYEIQNEEAYITSYLGSDACVAIPPEIEGYPVVSVHFPIWDRTVFDYSVEKVVLPTTIRELPGDAFCNYMTLQEIVGLEYVQSVGVCCFMFCPLEELVFSESLTTLTNGAFYLASPSRLVIPDNVQYHITSFSGMSVGTIELIQTGTAPTLALYDGMLFSADYSTLLKATESLAGTYVQIPDTTSLIVENAFYSLKINEVLIPDSVTEINYYAFQRGLNYAFVVYPESEGLRYVTELQQQFIGTTTNVECFVVGENESEFTPTEQLLQNIINETTTEGMSNYDKALALHDWLVNNLNYDYSLSCQNTVREVLKTKMAICQGYADTYAALLSVAGIRNTTAGNISHVFNAVYIDDAWFFIDCTWDDTTATHYFFGFTRRVKEYAYGTEDGVPSYNPNLSNTPEYHYWYQMGYMDELTTTVISEITARLTSGEQNFTVTPTYNMLDGIIPDFYVVSEGTRWTSRKNIAGCLLADYIENHVLNNYVDLHCLCDADGILTICTSTDADNYSYTIQDGKCTIISYSGEETVVTVPAVIDGAQVTGIDQNAFAANLTIEKVILPEGLQSIGMWAFCDCENLQEIVLPSTLVLINTGAFSNTGLISCELPDGLQYMGMSVFGECHHLQTVSIPATVGTLPDPANGKPAYEMTLANWTFSRCTSLTTVTVSDGITAIGEGCFSECYHLKNVNIPSSIQQIGSDAFSMCLSLEEISLPNGLSIITGGLFSHCESLTSIIIPDTVTTIEDLAFRGCKSLTVLNMPESVQSIGNSAFCLCTSLSSIVIPEGVTVLSQQLFQQCDALRTITLPKTLTTIDKWALNGLLLSDVYYNGSAEKWALVSIDTTNTSCINNAVIHYGETAVPMVLPASLQVIKAGAFAGSQASIVIVPDSCLSIESMAFANCTSLVEVILSPETVVAEDAFIGCGNFMITYR